jgi:hypothetical protein
MTSRRGIGLGPWLWAACLVVAPAFPTVVRAQPGFGPDPFWPYNAQYTPYIEPIGPASPEAGQGFPPVLPRPGLAGANRFQEYLDSVMGTGRGPGTDRSVSGVGMPYYRSTIDPAYEQTYKRDYRPNLQADRGYDRRQEVVTDLYLAYFAERDPKKRATLLKQYRQVRRSSSSALGTRRESPSRLLQSASRLRSELEPSTPGEGDRAGSSSRPQPRFGAAGRADTPAARPDPSAALRAGSVDPARRSASGSGLGLPSPLLPLGTPRLGDRPRRSPSEILNRARALDARSDRVPGSPSSGTNRRRSSSPPPPPLRPE